MRIAILAALSREYLPVLGLLGAPKRLASDLLRVWSDETAGRQILVVETGIGPRHAAEAARRIVARYPLDLMLSVGFAGGISPELRVGDVVWSEELASFDETGGRVLTQYACGPARDRGATRGPGSPRGQGAIPGPRGFWADRGIRPVRFVTVERLQPAARLAALIGEATAVAEMESTAVAAIAHRHGIPFLGLRAISDVATDTADLDLEALIDREGRISVPRATWAVAQKPSLVRSFRRWQADSRIAGARLAQALLAVLRLPEEDLRSLAGELSPCAAACSARTPEPSEVE